MVLRSSQVGHEVPVPEVAELREQREPLGWLGEL